MKGRMREGIVNVRCRGFCGPAILIAILLAVAAGPAQAGSPKSRGRAVAQKGPPGALCIMALAATGKLAIGSLDVTGKPNVCVARSPACPDFQPANSCDVYNDSQDANSTVVTGGAAISARNYRLSGSYSVDSSGDMYHTGQVETYAPQMPDPYADLVIPPYYGCNQGSLSPLQAWSPSTSTTITPTGSTPYVICGGLTVNGGVTLTLNPGIYIIDSGNLTVNGGGTLNGSGATIILTSSTGSYGAVQFNGNGGTPINVNLSAPTSGPTAGVAIWVDKNAPQSSSLKNTFNGGSTQVINGAIYLPSQEADFSGGNSNGTGCTQLVALTIKFTGNAYLAHNCSTTATRDPAGPPRLVE